MELVGWKIVGLIENSAVSFQTETHPDFDFDIPFSISRWIAYRGSKHCVLTYFHVTTYNTLTVIGILVLFSFMGSFIVS